MAVTELLLGFLLGGSYVRGLLDWFPQGDSELQADEKMTTNAERERERLE